MARAIYLDSSAIVKLVRDERESDALKRYLRRRRPLISSALARAEVMRAVLPGGEAAARRAREVLRGIDLARVSDTVLDAAGAMMPVDLRSLDAVHLATAGRLREDISAIVSYDERLSTAARELRFTVRSPS